MKFKLPAAGRAVARTAEERSSSVWSQELAYRLQERAEIDRLYQIGTGPQTRALFQMLMDKAAFLDFVIEIIRKLEGQQGFEVPPRRWVVERTFGWTMRWRRLLRDDEKRIDVSEAMIQVAMGSLPLRRIAH